MTEWDVLNYYFLHVCQFILACNFYLYSYRLQVAFPASDGGVDVHIAVANFLVERGDYFVLPLKKVSACQVHACDGVVRYEGTVAGEILYKEL